MCNSMIKIYYRYFLFNIKISHKCDNDHAIILLSRMDVLTKVSIMSANETRID